LWQKRCFDKPINYIKFCAMPLFTTPASITQLKESKQMKKNKAQYFIVPNVTISNNMSNSPFGEWIRAV
jgi:hypothetical protein